ncbi:MAG: hypothetical protein QM778_16290 [Myxococcales bacterium]
MLAWRVHDFQIKSGNAKHKAPKSPRPPKVDQLWHNAFHELLKENAGEIKDMLAAVADSFTDTPRKVEKLVKELHEDLATSVTQALDLARRARVPELGVKVNAPAKGKLMLVRKNQQPFKLGKLTLHVLGPSQTDLDHLRVEWNDWLRTHKEQLKQVRERASKAEKDLGNSAQSIVNVEAATLTGMRDFVLQRQKNLATAATQQKLGERTAVTTPNLASLMLLAEDGTRSVLLTGDGHADDLIKGLRSIGKLNGSGLHLDVLKVQHHGSEHNMTQDFARNVTADHYVFCGNGFSTNPELIVIQTLVDARLAGFGPNRPFKLWFNASPSDKGKYQAHMKQVKQLVDGIAKANKRVKVEFMAANKASFRVLV